MWQYYLKGKGRQERKKASPMDNELPDELPETYIENAEYDCLHNEGIASVSYTHLDVYKRQPKVRLAHSPVPVTGRRIYIPYNSTRKCAIQNSAMIS